jgi:hypothetical protein
MRITGRKCIQGMVFMLVLTWLISGAFAQEQKPAEIKPGVDGMYLLKNMADCLSGAKQLQVSITSGYDVVQQSGQKIEFRETRQMALVRPAKLRIDVERDDGNKSLFLFDGSNIAVYDPDRKVLATASRPGDVDGAVKYFVKDLKMRIPLALLLTTTLPAEIEKRIKSAKVVQRVTLLDVPCLQIAAREDNVDFQVWIPEKGEPLPRRIVITYRKDKGQPQFWADFSHWDLASGAPESAFSFVPPDGTERVPFLAEIVKPSGVRKAKGGRR